MVSEEGPTRSGAVLDGFSAPVPDAMARRAAAYPASGGPVEPRLSASVILVRDAVGAAGGVEVYLLHRHSRMQFAPSMAVFPGGGLDPIDRDAPDPLRACACRETEEETGVRLTADALRPWAHWITPECEALRFDTVFYVAALPEGQVAADLSGETERADWLSAAEALAQRERGELSLMPPTWAMLTELAAAPDVEALLVAAQRRTIETILPRLVPTGSGWAYAYEVLDR